MKRGDTAAANRHIYDLGKAVDGDGESVEKTPTYSHCCCALVRNFQAQQGVWPGPCALQGQMQEAGAHPVYGYYEVAVKRNQSLCCGWLARVMPSNLF